MVYRNTIEDQIKILEERQKLILNNPVYQGVNGAEQACLIGETIGKLTIMVADLPIQKESESE